MSQDSILPTARLFASLEDKSTTADSLVHHYRDPAACQLPAPVWRQLYTARLCVHYIEAAELPIVCGVDIHALCLSIPCLPKLSAVLMAGLRLPHPDPAGIETAVC